MCAVAQKEGELTSALVERRASLLAEKNNLHLTNQPNKVSIQENCDHNKNLSTISIDITDKKGNFGGVTTRLANSSDKGI